MVAKSNITLERDKNILRLDQGGLSSRGIAIELFGRSTAKSTVGDVLRRYKSLYSTKEIGDLVKGKNEKVSPEVDTDAIFKIETSKITPDGCSHFIIPDTQVTPTTPVDHLRWVGEYLLDRKPDVIIHLGDHADMESLSSYDKGKKSAEGKRVNEDIKAAISAMKVLLKPLYDYQQEELKEYGEIRYKPRMVFNTGNHEYRIHRHVDANPELHGFLSTDSLRYADFGWEVAEFLVPVIINGVAYAHFAANPFTGKPYGGSAMNILSKVGTSMTVGHKQCLDISTRNLPTTGQQQWFIVAGACLEKNHKVLTSDLKYIKLGDVEVGQKLVSFTENPLGKRKRRYEEGTVLKRREVKKETHRVVLSSGKEFTVTEDHLWFVKTGGRYRWVRTDKLRKGTCVPKLLQEWEALDTFEAGWLSGMYDGEGCLYQRKTTGGTCFQLDISQAHGPVLDRLKTSLQSVCKELTLTTTDPRKGGENLKPVDSLRIKGGVYNILSVLGKLRPERLISKFTPNNMGSICIPDERNDKVVSITPSGEKSVIELDIDKKTMIVEGYGHHNCYLHDETYKGPQGNYHWRGVIVKHNVTQGSYSPMFVDLDYLKKRFG